MSEIKVSSAADTSLVFEDGAWLLRTPDGLEQVGDPSAQALLPLLERQPAEVLAAAQAVGARPPVEGIIVSALRSGSTYWQERCVVWIREFDFARSGEVGQAAAAVVGERRASQYARQQLGRWLLGKPWK